MKRKRLLINDIFFYTGLVLVFGLIGLFISMASFWYAYIILIGAVLFLIAMRSTALWNRIIKLACWVIAISIACTGLYFARIDHNVSVQSVIVRESIRTTIRLPKLRNDKFMELGAKLSQKLMKSRPPKGYTLDTYDVDGLPVEILSNNKVDNENLILHFHGGGYVIKYMDVYRHIAHKYSKASDGTTVASIDYRVAPNDTFPAALEDAEKAWDWLLEKGYKAENIIIIGDSAGGNLALSLTAKLRDTNKDLPKALVLLSPWADMAGQGESHTTNQNKDPIFGNKDGIVNNKDGTQNKYAGDYDLTDPYLSPVYGDFDGFPPMLIQVGTYEILESDSDTVHQKAEAEGVNVVLSKYEGMFHVFQLAGNLLPESKQAWQEISEYLISTFNE